MNFPRISVLCTLGICLTLASPVSVEAHCDRIDGPVVKAAQQALATGDVNLVLIWVRESDEPEIRAAFKNTQAVRVLSSQARDLADRYFFETLVRVHRTGEGAAYTGLKPASDAIDPAVAAADRALDSQSLAPVLGLLMRSLEDRLRAEFADVNTARNYARDDLKAGREYVSAYVEFIHYVDRLYAAITNRPAEHAPNEVSRTRR